MQAAEFYMRAGLHDAAIPHLDAATRLSPKAPLPWMALGDAATLTDRYPLAKRAYARAAALSPENPLVARGRGQLLIRQRRLREAQQVLDDALERHPQDPDLRTALGGLSILLNQPRRAINLVRPIVEKAPDRADLHALLADAYVKDLHLEAAVAELREVVRLNQADDRAWGRLGLYLIKLGRKAEAREPLQRALALRPRESHYYWALAGSYDPVAADPASFEASVSLHRTALKLDPHNLEALSTFSTLLARRGGPGDLEEAAKLLQRALADHPDEPSAYYKLAQIYQRLGRPSEAKTHSEKFEALFRQQDRANRKIQRAASFEDTAEGHLDRGRGHLARREYESAAAEFRLALDRNPALATAQSGLKQAAAQSRPGTSSSQPGRPP
jgi:Flp pilus assembly protein TadD